MTDMAYVAKCKCGGMIMAAMDKPEYAKDTANEVAACIKDGYEIVRISVEDARSLDFCENHGKCTKHPSLFESPKNK